MQLEKKIYLKLTSACKACCLTYIGKFISDTTLGSDVSSCMAKAGLVRSVTKLLPWSKGVTTTQA